MADRSRDLFLALSARYVSHLLDSKGNNQMNETFYSFHLRGGAASSPFAVHGIRGHRRHQLHARPLRQSAQQTISLNINSIKFILNFSDECEFNADFCEWSNQDKGDDFDWSLSRGSLWTHTGPIRDQLSSGNGFNFGRQFIYIKFE